MNTKHYKTAKEEIIELHTGISVEQWEENNKKLEQMISSQVEEFIENTFTSESDKSCLKKS